MPSWTNIFFPARNDREIMQKLDEIERLLQMTKEELGQAIDALAAQLNKALQEIITAIQNVDNIPQDIVDKLTAAQAVAQQLDDLNPDAPKPQP